MGFYVVWEKEKDFRGIVALVGEKLIDEKLNFGQVKS